MPASPASRRQHNPDIIYETEHLDGCYVIKTELPQEEVAAETVHQRYKDLAFVEQGFRTIKTGLLETRPIFVRKEQRTKANPLNFLEIARRNDQVGVDVAPVEHGQTSAMSNKGLHVCQWSVVSG